MFEEILARLAAALDRHGIPGMVIGGQDDSVFAARFAAIAATPEGT